MPSDTFYSDLQAQERAQSLAELAVKNLVTLVTPNGTALRSSIDKEASSSEHMVRPTATAHVVMALSDCGVRPVIGQNGDFVKINKRGLSRLNFSNIDQHFNYPKFAQKANMWARQSGVNPTHDNWLDGLKTLSSHNSKNTAEPRELIFYGHVLPAISFCTSPLCIQHQSLHTIALMRRGITHGVRTVSELVHTSLPDDQRNAPNLAEPGSILWHFSPYFAYNAACAIQACDDGIKRIGVATERLRDWLTIEPKAKQAATDNATDANNDTDVIDMCKNKLKEYFYISINYLLARHTTPNLADFDATSLAFCLRGLDLIDPSFRDSPTYACGLQVVAHSILDDGCWQDGISAYASDTGVFIQQPSVEVAMCLAGCVFHREFMHQPTRRELEMIEIALPALRRHLDYLANTHTRGLLGTQEIAGWCSDRARRPGLVETWITCLVARFAHLMYLLERSRTRAQILSNTFGYSFPLNRQSRPNYARHKSSTSFHEMVEEPDRIVQPVRCITKEFIEPIEQRWSESRYIIRPAEEGVSFLLFGPPGSGKTHMIQSLSEALGWPLVSLNPGHFIREGIEHIESVSRDIFEQIRHLDHSIVFFDECDELFRDREGDNGQLRNILSFATASMLPKLQELHDTRSCIFVVATNYLSRIDAAIRRRGRFDQVLLLDRPDSIGRGNLVLNALRKANPGLESDKARFDHAIDEAIRVIDESAGFAAGDVYKFGRKLFAADGLPKDPLALSRAKARLSRDYHDWCEASAENEILAAGYSDDIVEAKRQDWSEITTSNKKNGVNCQK